MRRILDRFLADIQRNPSWYSLAALAVGMFAVESIREYERLRRLARDLERDMTARLPEITDRMAIARQAENDARYDRRWWGEEGDESR